MEISQLFKPIDNNFTVYVTEAAFAVGQGYDYFHSFKSTSNLIRTDKQIKNRFSKIIKSVEKNATPISKLLALFAPSVPLVSLSEAVTALCKLFTVHEHQAVGPDVIDPIILLEGKISSKMITKLININKDSILSPAIIIILKDNDFERALKVLADCPDGINIKMIRNNGDHVIYKVINGGANCITEFVDAFSGHCFSTCSKTRRELLLNQEWSNDPVVSKYAPSLFQIRSSLLLDYKDDVRMDLIQLIHMLEAENTMRNGDPSIVNCILCIAKLFLVFCNDRGGNEITDAYQIAADLNSEILLGHIYRYAEFLPQCSDIEKESLYDEGYRIFKQNSLMDHALYCRNNKLVQQFYSDQIFPEEFRSMQEEAVNCVPGMVGLSHIYNNVGIAYLYCGNPEMAIDFFHRGLDYAKHDDRIVQQLALKSNELLARSYAYDTIAEKEFFLLMQQIFDGLGVTRLSFLSADYVLNILSVAYRQKKELGKDLLYLHISRIKELINSSFSANPMGSGERLLQMQVLTSLYKEDAFPLLQLCNIPQKQFLTIPQGKKREFIIKYGFNLFEFNTWL